jgi:flagella basal body P-ring formation protein FlgA
MRIAINLLVGLMLLTSPAGKAARAAQAPVQPLDDIRASVTHFLEERRDPGAVDVRVSVGTLDARLRLPRCEQALAPFLPPGRGSSGHVTVGVRCTGARPWTVYVPARIESYVRVAVLTGPVARGEALGPADLSMEVREVGSLGGGYFVEAESALGLIARRTLSAGATVRVSMLEQPKLVRRGERVALIAANSAIQVRAEGRALRDGVRGQVIGVRNPRSNRVVEGVVVSPGVVEVRL